MPIEMRAVKQFVTDARRHVDRLKADVRELQRSRDRLGSSFASESRFSSDAAKLKDQMREVERSVDRMKETLKSIEKNAK